MKRRCGPKEKWWMRRRKAVGAMPVLRAKSALNEPRLWNPTSKQMWGHRRIGEDQAPRCLEPHPRQVLVRRHPEGGAEKAEEVEGRQRPRGPAHADREAPRSGRGWRRGRGAAGGSCRRGPCGNRAHLITELRVGYASGWVPGGVDPLDNLLSFRSGGACLTRPGA